MSDSAPNESVPNESVPEESVPQDPYRQLLESLLALAETAVAWLRQELEVAVRDKVAKPLIGASAVAAVASTALASVVFTGVALLAVGVAWWLGYAIGFAASSVVVGILTLGACGLGLYALIRAVRQ